MNKFIVPLILVAVAIVGIGFYQGWFQVGSDSSKGKSNVTISMDKDKIKEDGKAAVTKAEDMGHQLNQKISGTSEKSMDGTVVSVTNDKLTMTTKEGKEHSHALVANVKVTCDGKACTVADLRTGMRIRVTADTTLQQTASQIEAIDKDQDFKKGA